MCRRDRAKGNPIKLPASRVHNDYTAWSGPQRVRDLLPQEAGDVRRSVAVVIDVLRATTSILALLERGCAEVVVAPSVDAARRLISILQSGPRCGVYTLMSIDTQQPVPQGFNMKDLQQAGVHLVWNGDRFQWHDNDFEQFPLRVDAAPPAELCNRVLHVVGAKARDAKRVEVPFEFVAPPPEQWWTADSRPAARRSSACRWTTQSSRRRWR